MPRSSDSPHRDLIENTRALHDTAINTLGAIASGGGALSDLDQLRSRCTRDAAVIERLLAADGLGRSAVDVDEAVPSTPLRMVRTGADDRELDRCVSLFPDEMTRTLVAAIHELVLNASKHAGVDEVTIDADVHDSGLTLTVSDIGVGFDPARVTMRGLSHSVIERCREVGIDVTVDSTPGGGTTVALNATFEFSVHPTLPTLGLPSLSHDEESEVSRAACWGWAGMTTWTGIVVALVHGGHAPFTVAMVALVALMTLVAYLSVGDDGLVAAPVTWAIVVSVPISLYLCLSAIDLAHGPLLGLHAVGLTPLLAILLVMTPSRLPLITACWLLIPAAAVHLLPVWADSPARSVAIIVAIAPQFALFGCWLFFHPLMKQLARQIDHDRLEELAQHLDTDARRAMALARVRWTAAGLRQSAEILQSIADGTLDISASEVRTRCGEEERYLRQLLTLNPELVRIGPILVRAMHRARSRSVSLTLRTGSVDVPSDSAAASMGDLLTRVVESAPAGSSVTVGLFSTDPHPLLTIVGPPEAFAAIDVADLALVPDATIEVSTEEQTILEVELSEGTTAR